ncbi:glycosyltransferase family 4 protein [Mucilaginibacter sp.]|jgi:glycosyltransferase involved in cell wall biosynthesis|uniref:glycosyltransferase family 4 protein n=1 Tax=Mucilaginibacter sp. TaxID=1882438 RepID=UPI002C676021|nr:glycosyltransferase family 4 protein [Mucilaginibacter sp.]HTI58383.1 glycosyltransferase family 4 protein [Mucilaginibacter sp.]
MKRLDIKVAFITRSTLYRVPGGDTVQVKETARHLQNMGISAEIKLADEDIDYDRYNLLHFFNLTRPADILRHSKKGQKPFVISTILCNYSEYDKQYRKGISVLFNLMPGDGIEYVKAIARWLKGNDYLPGPEYLWRGQRNSIIRVLKNSAMILPNSVSEYERITQTYPCKVKYAIVPNGIDNTLFRRDSSVQKDGKMVLCVARIEGIKNQLNLIRALNNTHFKLVLIGSHAPNQKAYYDECRRIAAANITFVDHIPQAGLVTYYQKAKVHILPSWFETTGLSSLEAAAMGCNVVITGKGDAKEYFGNNAWYCDPADPQNIRSAVEQASLSDYNDTLHEAILKKYTWQQAALETYKAYQNINL